MAKFRWEIPLPRHQPEKSAEPLMAKSSQDLQAQPLTLLRFLKNLMKLIAGVDEVGRGSLIGPVYAAAVILNKDADKEILKEHSEGLIVLSGCPSAELFKKIVSGDEKSITDTISWYKEVFGDDYYLEIMRHENVDNQEKVNQWIINNYKQLNIKIVATNDNHYETKDDYEKEVLLKNVRSGSSNPRSDLLEDNSYYIMSPEEMREKFKDIPEACDNTLEIADKCNVKIDFSKTMIPDFKAPEKKDIAINGAAIEYLDAKINELKAANDNPLLN